MVLVALIHVGGTVKQGRQPNRVIPRCGCLDWKFPEPNLVPQSVALEVHLINNVEAVLISQLIEERVVRVVAGANRIQAGLFQGDHIGLSFLTRHDAALQPELVTVNAEEDDAFAVYLHQSVFDSETTNTNLQGNVLEDDALVVGYLNLSFVEIRVFGGPQVGVGQGNDKLPVLVHIQGLPTQPDNDASFALDIRINLDICGSEVVSNVDADVNVPHVGSRVSPQNNVAEDPGEAEEILVFQPRGRTPLEHFGGQLVLALDQKFCDVKLRGREAVLCVANKCAVEPQGNRTLSAVEGDGDTFTGLRGAIQRKVLHVARRGVEPHGDFRDL